MYEHRLDELEAAVVDIRKMSESDTYRVSMRLNSGRSVPVVDYSSYRERKQAIADRIKAAKAELGNREIDRAEGHRFIITKVEAVRWNLDLTAVREALGEAWCTAHSKVANIISFRISVNRAAALREAA